MSKPRKCQKPAYVVKKSPKSEFAEFHTEQSVSQVKSLMSSSSYKHSYTSSAADMTKPKKSQRTNFVTKRSPKREQDEIPSEQRKSQMRSLMGSPPYITDSQGDRRRPSSSKKSGQDSQGRNSGPKRPAQMKTSGGPARSLMSIDFSSMRMNNPDKSRSGGQRYNSPSSDDKANSDRRNDWKSGRRHQDQRQSMESEKRSMWRGGQQSSLRAPLIVDMGQHKNSNDLHSMDQPKSLLGDYWTSIASRPASLMDFKPQDRMSHCHIQQETFSRNEHFYPHSIPQRSLPPANRREEPPSRKRPHRPSQSEPSEKKVLKSEQSHWPPSEAAS
ncbi:hypothetical protein ElyMa_004797900, partial [Elysia marginata]